MDLPSVTALLNSAQKSAPGHVVYTYRETITFKTKIPSTPAGETAATEQSDPITVACRCWISIDSCSSIPSSELRTWTLNFAMVKVRPVVTAGRTTMNPQIQVNQENLRYYILPTPLFLENESAPQTMPFYWGKWVLKEEFKIEKYCGDPVVAYDDCLAWVRNSIQGYGELLKFIHAFSVHLSLRTTPSLDAQSSTFQGSDLSKVCGSKRKKRNKRGGRPSSHGSQQQSSSNSGSASSSGSTNDCEECLQGVRLQLKGDSTRLFQAWLKLLQRWELNLRTKLELLDPYKYLKLLLWPTPTILRLPEENEDDRLVLELYGNRPEVRRVRRVVEVLGENTNDEVAFSLNYGESTKNLDRPLSHLICRMALPERAKNTYCIFAARGRIAHSSFMVTARLFEMNRFAPQCKMLDYQEWTVNHDEIKRTKPDQPHKFIYWYLQYMIGKDCMQTKSSGSDLSKARGGRKRKRSGGRNDGRPSSGGSQQQSSPNSTETSLPDGAGILALSGKILRKRPSLAESPLVKKLVECLQKPLIEIVKNRKNEVVHASPSGINRSGSMPPRSPNSLISSYPANHRKSTSGSSSEPTHLAFTPPVPTDRASDSSEPTYLAFTPPVPTDRARAPSEPTHLAFTPPVPTDRASDSSEPTDRASDSSEPTYLALTPPVPR